MATVLMGGLANVAVAATASTTTLKGSLSAPAVGQAMVLTATVAKATTGYPTGTVTFKRGTTTLKSGVALTNGVASYTLPAFTATGSFSYTATFVSSTTTVSGSTSAALAVSVKYSTQTSVALSATTAAPGQSVNITATVASAGATSGTITFKEGATVLGTATLSSGKATLAKSWTTAGSHVITAFYAGTTTSYASDSTGLPQTLKVLYPASMALSASPNPATTSQVVTLTARVTSAGSPTGQVTFSEGAAVYGSANLSGGVATLAVALSTPGAHTISATYFGDAVNDLAYGATSLNIMGNPSMSVSSSATQPVVGQAVPIVVTLSGGSGTKTGTVTFSEGGTKIGQATVSGNQATFNYISNVAGAHSVNAAYSGDANNTAATAPNITLTLKYAPAAALSAQAPLGVRAGQAVTLVASVTGNASISGAVEFEIDGAPLGSATVVGGKAVLRTTVAAAGTYTYSAQYLGDANNWAASSNASSVKFVGRNYYVSSADQNASDDNDGTILKPWQTLKNVAALKLGTDQTLLLKCGGEWRETLKLSAANVVNATSDVFSVDAYAVDAAGTETVGNCATQALPLLNAANPVSGLWTADPKEASNAQIQLAKGLAVRQVLVNVGGKWIRLPEARHPNADFFKAAADVAHDKDGHATEAWLTIALNDYNDFITSRSESLIGAGIHIRTSDYSFEDRVVSSYSVGAAGTNVGVLNLGPAPGDVGKRALTVYPAAKGNGYVLTGKEWMIDESGEWFYDSISGLLKIRAFSGLDPNTLQFQVSVRDFGVVTNGVTVSLKHLAVRGASNDGIAVNNGKSSVIAENNVTMSGRMGVAIDFDAAVLREAHLDGDANLPWSNDVKIQDNTVTYSRHSGVMTRAPLTMATIERNVVQDSGTNATGDVSPVPMKLEPHETNAGLSINSASTGRADILDNKVSRSGYLGIGFSAVSKSLDNDPDKTFVKRNVVEDSCLLLDDCGAIYTYSAHLGEPSATFYPGAIVAKNIVRGAWSNAAGTNRKRPLGGAGIYLDDNSRKINVDGNVIYDVSVGIVLHNNHDQWVGNNKVLAVRKNCLTIDNTGLVAATSVSVVNNTCVAGGIYGAPPADGDELHATRNVADAVMLMQNALSPISEFGSKYNFSGNTYLSLYGGQTYRFEEAAGIWYHSLDAAGWQALTGEAVVGRTPVLAPYRFQPNATFVNPVLNPNLSMLSDSARLTPAGWWARWNDLSDAGRLEESMAVHASKTYTKQESAACVSASQPCGAQKGELGLTAANGFPLEEGADYLLTIKTRTPNAPTRVVDGLSLRCGSLSKSVYWQYTQAPTSQWSTLAVPFAVPLKSAFDGQTACDPGSQISASFEFNTYTVRPELNSPAPRVGTYTNPVTGEVSTGTYYMPWGGQDALQWDDFIVQKGTLSYGTSQDDYRILVNEQDVDANVSCPDVGALAWRCSQYVDINRQPVSWDRMVKARSAEIVIWTGSSFYNPQ